MASAKAIFMVIVKVNLFIFVAVFLAVLLVYIDKVFPDVLFNLTKKTF